MDVPLGGRLRKRYSTGTDVGAAAGADVQEEPERMSNMFSGKGVLMDDFVDDEDLDCVGRSPTNHRGNGTARLAVEGRPNTSDGSMRGRTGGA